MADNSNVIVMDISNNVKDSIGKLAKALKDGNNIVIFPEGTRTKDGEIAEFKQTFAIIAKEMNVPVVPICVSGAFEKIKVGKTFPSFNAEIKVSFLPEMKPLENESYEEFASKVRGVIEEKLNQCNSSKK
jgi:long-chain acyl-CoA synthetase